LCYSLLTAADYIEEFSHRWNDALSKWIIGDKEEHEKNIMEKITPNFLAKVEKVFFKAGRKFVAGDMVLIYLNLFPHNSD